MSFDVNSEWTQEINTLIITNGAAADTTSIYADTDINDTSGHLGATEADGGALSLAAIATRLHELLHMGVCCDHSEFSGDCAHPDRTGVWNEAERVRPVDEST